jgi:hypothetical protein
MEARREQLLANLFALKESHKAVVDRKTVSKSAFANLKRHRQKLQETAQSHRIEELSQLVTHVFEYLDDIESSNGTTWAIVDDLAEKTATLVQDVANLFIDTHASLLRRTIAINIEYELKRELLLVAGLEDEDEEDILKHTVKSAKKAAEDKNSMHTEAIVLSWFPDAEHSLIKFNEAMRLLKVASTGVHPTTDLDGSEIDMAKMTDLIKADFEIPQSSRLYNKRWEIPQKTTALYYIGKLAEIRKKEGSNKILFA